jgi:uncharacterized membrane protein YqgA involved in biofilm formation
MRESTVYNSIQTYFQEFAPIFREGLHQPIRTDCCNLVISSTPIGRIIGETHLFVQRHLNKLPHHLRRVGHGEWKIIRYVSSGQAVWTILYRASALSEWQAIRSALDDQHEMRRLEFTEDELDLP